MNTSLCVCLCRRHIWRMTISGVPPSNHRVHKYTTVYTFMSGIVTVFSITCSCMFQNTEEWFGQTNTLSKWVRSIAHIQRDIVEQYNIMRMHVHRVFPDRKLFSIVYSIGPSPSCGMPTSVGSYSCNTQFANYFTWMCKTKNVWKYWINHSVHSANLDSFIQT